LIHKLTVQIKWTRQSQPVRVHVNVVAARAAAAGAAAVVNHRSNKLYPR